MQEHPYRSSLFKEFLDLREDLVRHFNFEEEVTRLRVDAIQKVETASF